MIEEFEPVGALETQLVRQITVNLWRMERLFTLETGLLLNNMIETKREQLSAVEKKQYDLDLDALFPVNRTDEEEESFRKLMESINAERMELDQV